MTNDRAPDAIRREAELAQAMEGRKPHPMSICNDRAADAERNRATHCISHHHACACREAQFAALEQELAALHERYDEIHYEWEMACERDRSGRHEVAQLRKALDWITCEAREPAIVQLAEAALGRGEDPEGL